MNSFSSSTMSSSSSTLNYSLLAIPAYYIFSLAPHIYAGSLLSSQGYQVNNANPKASLSPSNTQGKVSDEVFQKYQRAENAHSNNTEQMPLFAAAVLASLLAERVTATGLQRSTVGHVDPTGLTTFIGAWFAVRTAYNIAYVQISSHQSSFFRSAMWAVGSGLGFYQVSVWIV